MNIYGRDIRIGSFVGSEYMCYLASFDSDSGVREEDTDMAVETIEEYIADNPVPRYLGQKYSSKLHPKAVLTKDSCVTTEEYFSEYEVRAILRLITGQRGYQWMKIITDEIGEDIWYRVRVEKVSYQKISGRVAGIILDMECDSQFAWSTEQLVVIPAKANVPFTVYSNSDDLHSYLYPYVEIIPSERGNISIKNTDDKDWTVRLNDVIAKETIRYDCANGIIDGSRNDSGQALVNYLDNSNCHFFKLKSGRNTFISNMDAQFTFRFREPRTVAFVNI